jgi:hypothetical protein
LFHPGFGRAGARHGRFTFACGRHGGGRHALIRQSNAEFGPKEAIEMRIPPTTLAAAAALTLVCGAAQAGELKIDAKTTAVGVGMICNTPEQAEQFLDLRARGTEAKDAVAEVNRNADDPRACGLAAIAFVPEKTVDAKPVANKLLQIVRINVVAGFNGDGWQAVPAMTQYAVIEGQGESI